MTRLSLLARILKRASAAGAPIDTALAGRLAAYLELLARWNRKINLTALRLDPEDDAAVDRLVIEPIIASRHVEADHRIALDVGSGTGSPALVLKLARPALEFTLVESKARKAAFLREAVRQLGLNKVAIENRRLEELAAATARYDLITIRGVRLDQRISDALEMIVRSGGRILAFVGATEGSNLPFGTPRFVDLIPERQSRLAIIDAP